MYFNVFFNVFQLQREHHPAVVSVSGAPDDTWRVWHAQWAPVLRHRHRKFTLLYLVDNTGNNMHFIIVNE